MNEHIQYDCEWSQLCDRVIDADGEIDIQNPTSLSFPINSIADHHYDTTTNKSLLTVNFWGLYGPDGLLPLNQQEEIFQILVHGAPIKDFLDIFQRHMFKHYLSLKKACSLLTTSQMAALVKLSPCHPRKRFDLEQACRQIFKHRQVELRDCIANWVEVAQHHQAALGQTRLGMDVLLGTKLRDATTWVQVHVYEVTWARFLDFISKQNIRGQLTNLLGPLYDYAVVFHFASNEVPLPSRLGSHYLGFNCCIGQSIVNLHSIMLMKGFT